MEARPGDSATPVVEMRGITKRFPGVVANDHVDFSLAKGEVHALLGENGAGKTTLMNVLYGLYRADEGEVWVRGSKVSIRSPKDSIALGIAMVHQRFELVPTLTVAENVALGTKVRREPLLDLGTASARITKLAEDYRLKVEPGALTDQLSVGERQRVEIIKALYRGANILILDEPTSVLTPQEADDLFRLLRSMAEEGRSVVVITHKLPEVMAVSDRVTVLRRGRVVARFATKLTNPGELAESMVGRAVSFEQGRVESAVESPVLELDGITAVNDKGSLGLDDLSLTLHAGEILGIAGVAGNGQTELEDVLAGMRKAIRGRVMVLGEDMTNAPPSEMIERGVGVIPEDRAGAGLIMELSVADNLILEQRSSPPFAKSLLSLGRKYYLNQAEIHAYAEKLIKEFSISVSTVDSPAYTLSGGNLQRLVLAKVLSREPKILVAAQPTAGLDVGATEFISAKLREQKSKRVGVLLISSDLNEVMSLSDRIACIYEGKIIGTVQAADASLRELGLMMGGVAVQ